MIDQLGVPASQLILSAEQTLYMVFVSLLVGSILAIILAMILVLTNDNGILKNRPIYLVLNTIINIIYGKCWKGHIIPSDTVLS